jgi:hypothetical protein
MSVMQYTVHYTVKKANGNQRCDRNFSLPLLENPIRGSEKKIITFHSGFIQQRR